MPPRAIKHQLTCPFELTSDSFLIGRRRNLVIPKNHLVMSLPALGAGFLLSSKPTNFGTRHRKNKPKESFENGKRLPKTDRHQNNAAIIEVTPFTLRATLRLEANPILFFTSLENGQWKNHYDET